MTRQLPLIVILGATACGKSKLAIDIARKFGGEIISADSMQVYRGLDIVTNKVTDLEQRLAKHHLIDIIDPPKRYSVVDFRNDALKIIDQLFEANKLPIVVGGTNYYIESIIWKSFIQASQLETSEHDLTIIDSENQLLETLPNEMFHNEDDLKDVNEFLKKPIFHHSFKNIDSDKLWKILEKLDPAASRHYHPHDKRRIIRCLQLIQRTNKTYTDILKDANKSNDDNTYSLGGPLRYDPTCVIWLSCDEEDLDKKLDERVDQMLERGLLAELDAFHKQYNRDLMIKGEEPDYTKGIFQTIGFKEFHKYLMLNEAERIEESGKKVLKDCIDAMKQVTRRYSRRQTTWIKRRILTAGTRNLPPLYKLVTSFDDEGWRNRVCPPAFDIVESFIDHRQLSDESEAFEVKPEHSSGQPFEPGMFHCTACDRILIGKKNITDHLRSRRHKRRQQSVGNNDKPELELSGVSQQ